MADTHQNQLAKHPNSSSRSKEKLAGYTPIDWVSLGARHIVQRRLSVPSRKSIVGSQCRAGEKQGGSLKQMAQAVARNVPPIPFRLASEHEQRLLQAFQPHHHGGSLAGEKPCGARYRERGVRYRESTASCGRQHLLVKVGPGAPGSKANKEKAGGKESLLYLKAQHLGLREGSGLLSRGQSPPPPTDQGARTFKGGGYM